LSCPNCGASIHAESKYCARCGTQVVIDEGQRVRVVSEEKAYWCPKCGNANKALDTFRCNSCGREYLCKGHRTGDICVDCSASRTQTAQPAPPQDKGKLCLKCLLKRTDATRRNAGTSEYPRFVTDNNSLSVVQARAMFVAESQNKCATCGHDVTRVASLERDVFSYTCRCGSNVKLTMIGSTTSMRCTQCGKKWDHGDWRGQIKRRYGLGFFV
jgi:hypothetical protein